MHPQVKVGLDEARERLLGARTLDELREATSPLPPPGEPAPQRPEDLVEVQFDAVDNTTDPPRRGTFVSVYPTVATRLEMARMRAVAIAGAPAWSVQDDDRALIEALVLCTHCLSKRPEWFDGAMQARVPDALLAVGGVIRAHHALFREAVARAGRAHARGNEPLVAIVTMVGSPLHAALGGQSAVGGSA